MLLSSFLVYGLFVPQPVWAASTVGVSAVPRHGSVLVVAQLIGGLREPVNEGFICDVMLKSLDPALVEAVISIMGAPGTATSTVGLLASPFGQGPILAVTGATQRRSLFEITGQRRPFGGGFGGRERALQKP
jgi:hypothetical protein